MDKEEKVVSTEVETADVTETECDEIESVEENEAEKKDGDSNGRMKILLAILVCAALVLVVWQINKAPAQEAPEQIPGVLAQGMPAADFDTAVNEWQNGDAARGFEMLKNYADRGLPQAQLLAALAYIEGRGTEKDVPAALAAAEKASGQLPQATDIVCQIYLGRFGNEYSDQAKAFEWSKKAVKQKMVSGYFYQSICYMGGIGCPQDTRKALLLLQFAAEQNFPPAVKSLENLSSIGPVIKVKL